MKWVILGLVLINAAFFWWQLSRDQAVVVIGEPASPPPSAAIVNRLLLVSEVEPGILRQRRSEPSRPPALQSGPSPAVQVTSSGAETPAVSRAEVLAGPPEPGRECYTIGPLEREDDISALSDWFSDQGSQAILRKDERREVVSTWVFLPPLGSREDADARVREMQAANIDDIFVIPRGDMANAISLGLYSQNNTLERRVTQLEERGFTPSVLPRYRTATASWFDVTTSAAQPMTIGVLGQIFPDLIIRQVACADAPIAGDPAITYNSPDLRQDDRSSDNAPGAALDGPGRPGTQ